ncbi:MAG: hypothetical protein QW087_03990 [Methanomassiliicoccales archaeon]
MQLGGLLEDLGCMATVCRGDNVDAVSLTPLAIANTARLDHADQKEY